MVVFADLATPPVPVAPHCADSEPMADEVEQVCPSALNYAVFHLTRREYEYSERTTANISPVWSFNGANAFYLSAFDLLISRRGPPDKLAQLARLACDANVQMKKKKKRVWMAVLVCLWAARFNRNAVKIKTGKHETEPNY